MSPKLFDNESERIIILALKNMSQQIHNCRKSYRHSDRKWQRSICWQAESARLFSTNCSDSALSLLRIIRHSRWPEPKSILSIKRHLSANIRNQFAPARYFPRRLHRPGFLFPSSKPVYILTGLSRKDLRWYQWKMKVKNAVLPGR